MTIYSPKGKNTGATVCVLLKYRVPVSEEDPRSGPYRNSPMALEDAQRTMGLVRLHAAEYRIDPHKIGVLGFSAGGHLSAAISTHFDKRLYPAVDAADQENCRPDFAVSLYPGHLWISGEKLELNPDDPVTKQTPPTSLLQAENDNVDSVNNSLFYYMALKNAGSRRKGIYTLKANMALDCARRSFR
jgi:acetyl esterase/lipase